MNKVFKKVIRYVWGTSKNRIDTMYISEFDGKKFGCLTGQPFTYGQFPTKGQHIIEIYEIDDEK